MSAWRRVRFTPFWRVTRWGFLPEYALRLNRGMDEFHNPTRFLIVPLVGDVVVWGRNARYSLEHLSGTDASGRFEGYDTPGCATCQELRKDLEGG